MSCAISVLFIETNLAVMTKRLIHFITFYESNAKLSSGSFLIALQMPLLWRKPRPLRKVRPVVTCVVLAWQPARPGRSQPARVPQHCNVI